MSNLRSRMDEQRVLQLCRRLTSVLSSLSKVKVTRKDADSPWQLVCEKSGPVDERWVELTEKGGADFLAPAANASKQRSVLEARTRCHKIIRTRLPFQSS